MDGRCKSCLDPIRPIRGDWRKDAPYKAGLNPDDYCRPCYMELATGAIPQVVGSHVTHGSGGLTFRQAVKKR